MWFNAPTNIVTSEPAAEPVVAADVKLNAYVVDDTSDDTFIADHLIPAARKMVEKLAGRSLITQTRKQIYDRMPPTCVFLRYGPVQSVSSFTYVDNNEASQTLSSTLYDVDTSRIPARLMIGYGDNWPTSIEKTNAVAITYVAGYGLTAATVPMLYRRAIVILATHWYNNRDVFGCDNDSVANRVCDMLGIEGRTLEYA